MLQMETLDLSEMPQGDRFGFFHDVISNSTGPSRFTSPAANNFAGYCRFVDLGGVQMASFRYPSLEMVRTHRMIRQSDPEMYELALPINGRSSLIQDRRQAVVEAGNEFTFLTTSRPYECSSISVDQPTVRTVAILIPQSALPLPPDKVNGLVARRLSSTKGMGSLLAGLLRQVAEQPDSFRPEDGPRLGRVALDLISATLAQHLDLGRALPDEVQQRALRVRIDNFISRNLGDLNLSPREIAAAHHISLRTLHRLFEGEESSVAELIRLRRLDQCGRDLANPLLANVPIYAIATRWGFPDKTHFSRLFRATYGMSPQQYRKEPPALLT
ncbi:helix-turn-helix domain-containing protein (plasmid) [Micromonospora zamorensis]|uniref:AraC-like ligand-binding domain-containing protein n=1 Tax=Micromonospora zamorensis TaxID=709883 RepID=UPI002E1A9BF5